MYITYLLIKFHIRQLKEDDLLKYVYYYSQFDIPIDIDCKPYNDLLLEAFQNNQPNYKGYSLFTFTLMKNPNHIQTLQQVDYLLEHNYTPTNIDITMVSNINYNYIYKSIDKYINFFNCINLIDDVKTVICYHLSQLILLDKAPIFRIISNNILILS